jgi:hypothetical protein
MSINVLPDDVLLEIFDFYVLKDYYDKESIEEWQSLVHVCRRWRRAVFGSPRRLDLQLFCATKALARTRVRDMLDLWPALPLLIEGSTNPEELDNIIAILERSDRVSHINIHFSGLHLEGVWSAMQKPFPELTRVSLYSSKAATAVPDSILGGSAPRLRLLRLDGITFPGLPKLLLSTTRLIFLYLTNIPYPEPFSLDAIVPVLSSLFHLDTLFLEFQSPRSRPSRGPPPLTRSVLPSVRSLKFKGVSDYLEQLVARIDTPRLEAFYITFFNQIVFDAPKTTQFICRTPSLGARVEARLAFRDDAADVRLSSQTPGLEQILVKIPCKEFDWQISSLEQVCTSSLPLLSKLEDLYIFEETKSPPNWKDNIENMLWLELLCPFTTVKNLYLSENFALRIVPALEELVGDRAAEVLPALQNIFLEDLQPSGPVQEGMAKFFATRQLSGHPITVSLWERAAFRSSRAIRQ